MFNECDDQQQAETDVNNRQNYCNAHFSYLHAMHGEA